MAKWTAADIPDQSGHVAVVTGANSGLGLVTARGLARAGATVVMGCRDLGKAEVAAASIREAVPGANLEIEALDLADLASIGAFAGRVKAHHPRIDLLINNAGVMAPPRRETKDGFEMQIGTNHLGHFALTGRLLPSLLASAEPRVVTISSVAHRTGKMDFDDLHSTRHYNRWRAYGQSKLSNLLFMRELARRAVGTELVSAAAHPGYSATHLQSSGPGTGGGIVSGLNTLTMRITNALLAQSDEMGALPALYAATMPDVRTGAYVGPDGFMERGGHPRYVGSTGASKNEADARRLWDVSVELTGVDYAEL